jgi:hypothetical protein
MLLDECDEINGRVTSQGRLSEVWIGGDEILRARIQIGEVASPASRDSNLLTNPLSMFKDNHAAAAIAGFNRTKKTCRSTSDYHNIALMHAQVSWTKSK